MQQLRAATPLASPRAGQRERVAPGGFVGLCIETLRVCTRHAGPLVGLAFIGFAAANVLGGVFSAWMISSQFPTQTFSSQLFVNVYSVQWLIQGAIGVFALSLARGAISWLALESSPATPTIGRALRAAARRFPALLVGSTIYGALITVCTLGLIAFLREQQFDLSNVNRLGVNYPDTLRAAVVRGFGYNVIPDPGSPFGDWLAYTRYMVRRVTLSGTYPSGTPVITTSAETIVPVAAVAVSLIVAIETLLRMRSVTAIVGKDSAMAAVRESVRIGARHFGRITLYSWTLRFGIAVFMALFVWLPLSAIQGFVVPYLARELTLGWLYSASGVVFLSAASLIYMLFGAYTAAFDARLFRQLTASGN